MSHVQHPLLSEYSDFLEEPVEPGLLVFLRLAVIDPTASPPTVTVVSGVPPIKIAATELFGRQRRDFAVLRELEPTFEADGLAYKDVRCFICALTDETGARHSFKEVPVKGSLGSQLKKCKTILELGELISQGTTSYITSYPDVLVCFSKSDFLRKVTHATPCDTVRSKEFHMEYKPGHNATLISTKANVTLCCQVEERREAHKLGITGAAYAQIHRHMRDEALSRNQQALQTAAALPQKSYFRFDLAIDNPLSFINKVSQPKTANSAHAGNLAQKRHTVYPISRSDRPPTLKGRIGNGDAPFAINKTSVSNRLKRKIVSLADPNPRPSKVRIVSTHPQIIVAMKSTKQDSPNSAVVKHYTPYMSTPLPRPHPALTYTGNLRRLEDYLLDLTSSRPGIEREAAMIGVDVDDYMDPSFRRRMGRSMIELAERRGADRNVRRWELFEALCKAVLVGGLLGYSAATQ